MTVDSHFQRVDELFRAASKIEAGQQAAFLAQRCGPDSTTYAEVISLLEVDQRPAGILDRPALGTTVRPDAFATRARETGQVPESIGRYRILRVIGEGGMGVVYEAQQDNPRRTVALKVINSSF